MHHHGHRRKQMALRKPLCPICGLELTPGRQTAIGVIEPQDHWSCLACGYTERVDVQHKDGRYRKTFETVKRTPTLIPAEAPRKEIKAVLVNNLICNIRKQRPDLNRKQVKRKAKEIAESLLAGTKAEEHEYRKELNRIRKLDQSEAMPVKPEDV